MSDVVLDVGACIYCGDRTPPLSREHVLPRGLGGGTAPEGHPNALVLQNASCEPCRRITQKIEEQCLLAMMGPGRAKLGLKRKDRATKIARVQVRTVGTCKEKRELDWAYVPGPIVLPAFYQAAELSGKPTPEVPPFDAKMIVVAPATKAMFGEVSEVGVTLNVDSQIFARMLAKIALGVAVATLGMGGFVAFVQDVILSEHGDYGRWVGGFAGANEPEQRTTDLHSVELKVCREYVIVEICLFAAYGGPRNYVVVGRAT